MIYRETLTQREVEIVQQIANGYTDREIAVLLRISDKTVSTHRKKILRRLNIKNTALLIRYAMRNKIVK